MKKQKHFEFKYETILFGPLFTYRGHITFTPRSLSKLKLKNVILYNSDLLFSKILKTDFLLVFVMMNFGKLGLVNLHLDKA
jgi:hypothetical protein